MSLSRGLSSLESDSLDFLTTIINDGQLFTSSNPLDWCGTVLLHLESKGPWSSSFECFLLDRGLALDLSAPCRSPSKVTTCFVRMPQPVWDIKCGTQFVSKANLLVDHDLLVAKIDSSLSVWPCGFHDVSAPVSFLHLYAGAFCGWHQAQDWLSANHHMCFAMQTVAVEKDFTTASYGATSVGAELISRGDFAHENNRSLMVCCDVAETRWMDFIRTGTNLMVTKSFPCQPFSKGGCKIGLNSVDGRSIVEAILKCRLIQPIGIALENVDEFRVHDHKPIVFELFKWAGFSCKWQTVHDLAAIAPAHRRRWLAVFIRSDLADNDIPIFQVDCNTIPSWSHAQYQFEMPESLIDQLILDRVQSAQYGDPRMLPPSKRSSASTSLSNKEILAQRCPAPGLKLATLVSSYSTQHVLPRKHLLWKGIFAELIHTGSDFRFFSPAMWTSLLGNMIELRLPKKLAIIFQFLGNAIATPHAAMGLLVMTSLLDLRLTETSIPDVVLSLWNDRLTAFNAMIIEDGDGFLVVKPSTFLCSKTLVKHHLILHHHHDSTWTFVWPDESCSVIHAQGAMTAEEILTALGFPSNIVSQWALVGNTHPDVFQGSQSVHSRNASFAFCFVPELLGDAVPSLCEVEPTQVWTQVPQSQPEGQIYITCVLPDATTRFVSCNPKQTIEEICRNFDLCVELVTITATFDDPTRGEPFRVTRHQQAQCFANCKLVFEWSYRSCKRSFAQIDRDQYLCKLEIASLTNQTKFVNCSQGETVKSALQKAAIPGELIDSIIPLCNGLRVDLNTEVAMLPSKAIRLSAAPLRGGTKEEKKEQDAVFMNDPWVTYKPVSQASNSSSVRWDELLLPDDHPWHIKGGERLFQISHMQIGPERAGVAFVARQNLEKLLQVKPPAPCLLLLPALRDLSRKDVALQDACMPVQQIIVKEPNGRTYKRVTLPVVLRGPIEFRIVDKPNMVAISSSSFSELVIEVLEILAPQATVDSLKNLPLEFFKRYISSIKIPLVEVSCYAYRKIKGKEGNIIHQALLKIPDSTRKQILQISGSDEVFIRQFINSNEDVDHSVLPRYFPTTVQDNRQAKQLGESLGDSYFGLALTAKGICIRCANNGLKDARAAILQSDVRFTDTNRHIVCKHYFVAQGFPFSMSHSAIIDAVMQAIKKPAIPMRSFKIAGMLSWVLAFETIPEHKAFTFKIGDQSFEVLLMPQDQVKQGKTTKVKEPRKQNVPKKMQATAKPQPIVSIPASTTNASDADKRLAVLENRVTSLETSHSHLANRVETRFDDIAEQLKKVLTCVSTPRPREPTGETPPGKHPRTSS